MRLEQCQHIFVVHLHFRARGHHILVVDQTRRVGQQVPHCHRLGRRWKGRKPPADAVVERKPPILHQEEDRRGGELLGDGGQAEVGTRRDGSPCFEIGEAVRTPYNGFTIPEDEQRCPGDVPAVAVEERVSTVSHRAFGHTLRDGSWIRKDQSSTSAVLGDGGIYSSIDDLAKWDAALYDSRFLSDESRRLAFSPHTPTKIEGVSYGFGWRISGETLSHTGETSGFRNVIIRYPARRLTVIMLTNRDDPEPYEMAESIAKRFF